jgi:hypothetical protein
VVTFSCDAVSYWPRAQEIWIPGLRQERIPE